MLSKVFDEYFADGTLHSGLEILDGGVSSTSVSTKYHAVTFGYIISYVAKGYKPDDVLQELFKRFISGELTCFKCVFIKKYVVRRRRKMESKIHLVDGKLYEGIVAFPDSIMNMFEPIINKMENGQSNV